MSISPDFSLFYAHVSPICYCKNISNHAITAVRVSKGVTLLLLAVKQS